MKDPIAIPNDLAVFSFKAWRSAFALLFGATIAFAFREVIQKKKKRERALVGSLGENRSQKRGMI
jgi:cbb3-type cytochrome oxidase subunit 3